MKLIPTTREEVVKTEIKVLVVELTQEEVALAVVDWVKKNGELDLRFRQQLKPEHLTFDAYVSVDDEVTFDGVTITQDVP